MYSQTAYINRLFFLIVFICLFSSPALSNQEQGTSAIQGEPSVSSKITLTKEEKTFIQSHPVIRFGTNYRWAPNVIKKDDGTIEGFDIDLIKLINERAGTNIQIVVGRWSEMVEQAKDLKIDGLAISAASKEREPFFNFSKPYSSVFPAFVVTATSKLKIDGINDLAGKSIAILKGNQFSLNLLSKYPSINVIELPSEVDAITLVVEGKADAAIVPTTAFYKHYKKFGRHITIGHVATDYPIDIVYSIRKDWPELLSIINKSLASVSPETINSFFSRWYGYNPASFKIDKKLLSPPAKAQIKLSKEERTFLKAHPTIRLGTDETWEPFVIKGADGTLKGLDVDFIRYINETTGANIQLVTGQWADMVSKAKSHEIDGVVTSAPLKERAPYFNFSDVYISEFALIIVRSDSTLKITKLGDLSGKTVAIQKGNEFYSSLLKPYPDIHIIEAVSETESVEMMLEGKADAAISGTSAYSTQIKKFLRTIKIAHVIDERPLDLVYSIRKDWPELLSIINKSFASIPRKTSDSIFSRWFGYNPGDFRVDKDRLEKPPPIIFSEEEQRWLNKNQIVRARVSNNPPFHFFKKEPLGISVEYLKIAAKQAGFKVEYITGIPWGDALEQIKNHEKLDLILSLKKTPERQKFITFTEDYLDWPWVIFTRKDSGFIGSMQDLFDKTVAVERGYVIQKILADEYPNIKLLEKEVPVNALQSLALGEVDAYVGNLMIGSYIIKTKGLDNIKIAAPTPFENHSLAMGIRDDWPELAGIINKVLATLTPQEHAAINDEWLPPIRYEYGISPADIVKWVLGISSISLLIIVIILGSNKKLAKEITVRKQAEDALQESERELAIRNRIAEIFLTTSDDKIYFELLQVVLKAMESPFGTIAYINEHGDRVVPVLTRDIWKECEVEDVDMVFPREKWSGIWGRCLINKETVSSSGPFNVPKGHIPITNAMAVPIIHQEEVIGNFMVSNKTTDYGEKDKELLETIADHIAPILQAKLLNDRHEKERKQAEDALQESEQQYRTLGETISYGAWITDATGYCTYVSPSFLEMVDMTMEQVQEFGWLHLLPLEDIEPTKEHWLQCVQTGEYFEREHRFRGKDGNFRNVLAIGRPIKDDTGKIVKWVGLNLDITKRKQAEKEREQLQSQLRQATKMQAVGTLAGGIAHEFNNMLGIIVGGVDIARDEVSSDSFARTQLDRVLKASLRATDLVKQILMFSRETMDQKHVPLNLAHSLRETLEFIKSSIPSSIAINTQIDTCNPVQGDPSEISQIIINLCANAVWAMKERGALGIRLEQIDLGSKEVKKHPEIKAGQYLKLSVSDTGKGMDSETKEQALNPFFTTKEVGQGTGMGLAIVDGIMGSHKGFVTIDSEVGKGTTFHLYFPTIKDVPVEMEHTVDDTKKTARIPVGNERILFVDDEEIYAEAEKDILESLGYSVTIETNSKEALEIFRAAPREFDLVITDQIMPHFSGYELAKELLVIRPDIPIILCTGFSTQINEEKAESIGIREFVMKPFEKKDIALLVRKVLDREIA